MRVLILQQAAFEEPGYVSDWCKARGASLRVLHVYDGSEFPPLEEFDLLVILGGPMSVNDEEKLGWLRPQKTFVRQAIESGKGVLGICLGSQMIASALGARVFRNTQKEIGWFDVEGCQVPDGYFQFPHQFESFHWHGETFDLPSGAIHLAKTPGCVNQAFQLGRRTIGLQFHLEATPESVESMLSNCRKELIPATYIQNESVIRSATPEQYASVNRLLSSVLDYLTSE